MPKQLTRSQMAELQKRLKTLQAWRAGRMTASYADVGEAVSLITKFFIDAGPKVDIYMAATDLQTNFQRIGSCIDGLTWRPLGDLVDITIVEDEPGIPLDAIG